MGFSQAVRRCFRSYARFRGRASRAEFWWFFVFLLLLDVVGAVIDGTLGLEELGPADLALSLLTLLPSAAVAVRRLHDTGRAGWWLLLPAVGLSAAAVWPAAASLAQAALLAFVIFAAMRGDAGPNRYGKDPLALPSLGT